MGNCIGTDIFSSKKKNIPLRSLDGVVEEHEVSKSVGKFISTDSGVVRFSGRVKALTRDVGLKSGEVCCFIPDRNEPPSRRAGKDSCRGRRVKIVVSKQQLGQLVRSMKKIPCSRVTAIQPFRRRKRYQKWRPSLATIPEL